MTVSPTVSVWINLILAVLAFVVGAGGVLTPIFGATTTASIVADSSMAIALINVVLHSISSPTTGPVAKMLKWK